MFWDTGKSRLCLLSKVANGDNIPQMLGLTRPNSYRFKNNHIPPHRGGIYKTARSHHFENRSVKRKPTPRQKFQDKQYSAYKQGPTKQNKQTTGFSAKPNETKNNQQYKSKPYKPNSSAKGNPNKKQK